MLKKGIALLTAGVIAFTTVPSVLAVAATPTFSASVISVPSSLQIGNTASYKFSIKNTSAVDSSGDISGCSFTAVYSTSQSAPGLTASGSVTVNGSTKSITGDYGSAGMLGLYFDPLTIPAGQTAQFSLTIGVASGVPAGASMETAVMCAPANATTTKYISIVGAPAPSASPAAATTPKVTASVAPAVTQKVNVPTSSIAPSATPLTTIYFAPTAVTLPSIYIQKESKTTDISKLSAEQLKSVDKFTLEVVGTARIEFKEPVDLSGVTTQLNQLDQYVRMNMVGDVFVDSEALKELNKPATITMAGLKFKKTPIIYKDNKPAGDAVSQVSYDAAKGVLVFDVTGFSRYTVVSADGNLLGSDSLYVVGALAVICLFVGGLWFATKEGRTRQVVTTSTSEKKSEVKAEQK